MLDKPKCKRLYESKGLYRKNKKGKMEESFHWVFQDSTGTVTVNRSLIVEGSAQRIYRSVVKEKPTKSAGDIAIAKAEHKVVLALRDGWTYDRAQAEVGVFVDKPMLLHKYIKSKGKIRFPCIVQPKLDGVRCTYHPGSQRLMSRGSKEYISPLVRAILLDTKDYLDGELYIHGNKLQDTIRAVKNGTNEPTFYIFDMPTTNGETYQERLKLLREKYPKLYRGIWDSVKFVSTHICNSHEEIMALHEQFVLSGFEGAVVKNLDGPYLWNDRSYDVQKVKGFIQEGVLVEVMSSEFGIVDCVCDQLASGGEGIAFICSTPKSPETFKVTPAWSHDKRRELWGLGDAEKTFNFVGEVLTVEYRGLTKDNLPIHAVGVAVRDYE